MSLARKVAREKAAPRRKRLTRAVKAARRDAVIASWHEQAQDIAAGPIADAADFEIDDLSGVEINSVRKLALVAGISLVIVYVLAGVMSGC